jgi:CMP-N-acetylneuraminic acid synthetase
LKDLPQGSGVSMLARVIRRLKDCQTVDNIIVVTPDDEIVKIAQKEGVLWSQTIMPRRDPLAEFYYAAQNDKVDTIVRITA